MPKLTLEEARERVKVMKIIAESARKEAETSEEYKKHLPKYEALLRKLKAEERRLMEDDKST